MDSIEELELLLETLRESEANASSWRRASIDDCRRNVRTENDRPRSRMPGLLGRLCPWSDSDVRTRLLPRLTGALREGEGDREMKSFKTKEVLGSGASGGSGGSGGNGRGGTSEDGLRAADEFST